MSENTGSTADAGQADQATEAPRPEVERGPLKPIPDSVWKRAKGPSESAVDSIIADSKKAANEAKAKRYDVEEIETPPDKAISRPDDTKGKEEIGADGRARDAQGRFVAADTDAAPVQDKEAPPKPAAPAATSKVKFAGQEWDDLSAAEKAYAERDWHLARAIESANAWKAEAEKRASGATAATPSEPSKPQTPASADAAAIDPEMAKYVWESANEAGRPELYAQWLAEENQKIFDAKLESLKAELVKPQQEAQAQEALKQEILNGWTSLKQYTRADGSPAFPEIGNFEAEQQIGEYWVALGLPPEVMRNPATMMAAIGLYRIMNEDTKTAASAAQPNIPTPPIPTNDADAVTTGLPSRVDPAAEPESPEARRLFSALNRVGHRGKDANGRVVNLWSR